jgi:hypothetical protein
LHVLVSHADAHEAHAERIVGWLVEEGACAWKRPRGGQGSVLRAHEEEARTHGELLLAIWDDDVDDLVDWEFASDPPDAVGAPASDGASEGLSQPA